MSARAGVCTTVVAAANIPCLMCQMHSPRELSCSVLLDVLEAVAAYCRSPPLQAVSFSGLAGFVCHRQHGSASNDAGSHCIQSAALQSDSSEPQAPGIALRGALRLRGDVMQGVFVQKQPVMLSPLWYVFEEDPGDLARHFATVAASAAPTAAAGSASAPNPAQTLRASAAAAEPRPGAPAPPTSDAAAEQPGPSGALHDHPGGSSEARTDGASGSTAVGVRDAALAGRAPPESGSRDLNQDENQDHISAADNGELQHGRAVQLYMHAAHPCKHAVTE